MANWILYAGQCGFYALIASLVFGRLGFLFVSLCGSKEAANKWASNFNRLTVYLR